MMLSTIKGSRHVKAFEKEVRCCSLTLTSICVCVCVVYNIGGPMGTNVVTHSGGDRNDRSSPKTMDVLGG